MDNTEADWRVLVVMISGWLGIGPEPFRRLEWINEWWGEPGLNRGGGGKVKTGDLPKKLVGGRKLGTTGEVKGVELGDLGLWARDECSVNQL